MIIGLTGGMGSGKTTVANLFRKQGVWVVNSDHIIRDLVAKGKPSLKKIVNHFGPTILQKDGTLNRSKLRSLIFNSPQEKKWLEDLLHPQVKKYILKLIPQIPKGKYLMVEIPLLVETDFQNEMDRVLVVDCDKKYQIERIIKRDNNSISLLKAILKNQVSRKTRLSFADDIIKNNGTEEALKKRVEDLHRYYIKLTKLQKF